MFNKLSFSIILLFACGYSGVGQVFDRFMTTEQEFIKRGTDSILFIICQEYVLEDSSGLRYGRGGKEYFGRAYSLGVSSENRLFCESRLETPWVFDNNFTPYNGLDSIRPILSKTSIRRLYEDEFKPLNTELEFDSDYDSLLKKRQILSYHLKDSLKGIKYLPESRDTSGWLVAIYTDEPLDQKDDGILKYAIYRANPTFAEGATEGRVNKPDVPANLLGGAYFDTDITIGNIGLCFSGLLIERPINWYITSMPGSDAETTISQITPSDPEPSREEESNGLSLNIQFLHKEGFILQGVDNIRVAGREESYTSDENGFVQIPVNDESHVLVLLNGMKAACVNANTNEPVRVICKYVRGNFFPKKAIKKCN